MTISRTREYSADRGGAEISGKPLALASALRKISAYAGRIPMATAERNPASAPLFIINPLSGQRMDNLFSTHPSTENRIRALEAIAAHDGPAEWPSGRARSRSSGAALVTVPGLAARAGGGGACSPASSTGSLSLADQVEAPDGPLAAWRPHERARAQALAAGTLRHLGRIDAVLARLPDPPSARRRAERAAAGGGGALPRRHAGACGGRRRGAAGASGRAAAALAGLVNAVARRVAEGGPALWEAAPEAGLPDWLARPVAAAWGEEVAAAIAAAHRRRGAARPDAPKPGRGGCLGDRARRRAAADRQPAARARRAGLGAARL